MVISVDSGGHSSTFIYSYMVSVAIILVTRVFLKSDFATKDECFVSLWWSGALFYCNLEDIVLVMNEFFQKVGH